MFNRAFRAKLALILLEFTSIPLFMGFYLVFLSGYGLVTEGVHRLTFGLVGRTESLFLHVLSPIPYLVGVLMALHALGGFELMILKYVKNSSLTRLLELANFVVFAFFLIQLTLLELA